MIKRIMFRLFIISAVLPSAALILNSLVIKNAEIEMWCCLSYLIPILLLVVFTLYVFTKYKGFKSYYYYCQLKKSVENSLINIGAYDEDENNLILPGITITEDKIYIDITNIRIRKCVESYIDIWSSGLWNNYIVEDISINDSATKLIIKYEDVRLYKKEIYTMQEFKERIRVLLRPNEIYLSKKHIIDLNTHPHWLIAGESGSGKTTLIEQIIIQSIHKNYRTIIADPHGALSYYDGFAEYYYDHLEILDMLQNVQDEMRKRMTAIRESKERGVVATDLGYQPVLVLIEEFIDLKGLYNKTDVKKFEEIILSLAVGARKAGIFLFISSQSIGTEVIPANARHNFSKILLGNPASNIIRSTFGDGITVPKVTFTNKGEGLICIDNKVSILKSAYIKDLNVTNVGS